MILEELFKDCATGYGLYCYQGKTINSESSRSARMIFSENMPLMQARHLKLKHWFKILGVRFNEKNNKESSCWLVQTGIT